MAVVCPKAVSCHTARYWPPVNATTGSKLRLPGGPTTGSSTATSGPMIGSRTAGKAVRATTAFGTVSRMTPSTKRAGIAVAIPSAEIQVALEYLSPEPAADAKWRPPEVSPTRACPRAATSTTRSPSDAGAAEKRQLCSTPPSTFLTSSVTPARSMNSPPLDSSITARVKPTSTGVCPARIALVSISSGAPRVIVPPPLAP